MTITLSRAQYSPLLRKILIVTFLIIGALPRHASAMDDFSTGLLNYAVRYKLGPIHKVAGYAQVRARCTDNKFFGTISGQSIHWGGRVYMVEDTLRAEIKLPEDGNFGSEKVTYRNGWYHKPKVSELNSKDFDLLAPANYRNIYSQGELSASPLTMEAISITSNLLALYAQFRYLPFDTFDYGKIINIPINGERKSEHVRIKYLGLSHFGTVNTYYVEFEYTYNGLMSCYRVPCHIDRTTRVPVMMSCVLPIGHVEMTLKD